MSTIALDLQLIHDYLGSLNYHFHTEAGTLNLLGVRSAVPEGTGSATLRTTPNQNNVYNDTVAVFGTNRSGQPVLQAFKATVDPGATYTLNPQKLGNRGCAHLANGSYRYRLGWHKRSKPSGHPALVEAGPVVVWRDYDRDWKQDATEHNLAPTMALGIHIHAGGTGSAVANWSAGCQVLWGGRLPGSPWPRFYQLVRSATNNLYWYNLVDAGPLLAFQQQGVGKLQPHAPELTIAAREAIQQVLTGFAVLYDHQQQAELGEEGGVPFLQMLNQLRNTGVLRNVPLAARPHTPPVADVSSARAAMRAGFRLLYAHWPKAGLDASFLMQLNRLRHFGPLRTL